MNQMTAIKSAPPVQPLAAISPEFAAALAAYRRAAEVSARYDDEIYDQPHAAWREAVDAIVHLNDPQARQAEEDRLRACYNIDLLGDESNRLTDLSCDAMHAVEEYPVDTLVDLIAKIEFSQKTGGLLVHEDLLSDLRRIAGEA